MKFEEMSEIFMSEQINLLSNDNQVVTTTYKAAILSGSIKGALVNQEESLKHKVHVNIDGDSLKLAVQWMEQHQDEPQLQRDEIEDMTTETISEWDESFLEMSLEQLYALVSSVQDQELNLLKLLIR